MQHMRNNEALSFLRRRRRGAWFPGFLLLVVLLSTLSATAQPRPRELRLLQRIPLPEAGSVATDIRWAGDDSVFVSWSRDGVVEVGLDGKRRRTLVPDTKTLGGPQNYTHLAVTPRLLAVASWNWAMTWRPRQAKQDGRVTFEQVDVASTNDFDVSGDRIVLLGRFKRLAEARDSSDVTWLGTLSSRLEDGRSVLQDVGGPGAPRYFRCASHEVGAVRFLADGSFLIVPGFQEGVHLFTADGRRARTWTSEQAGINSHAGCAEMTDEEEEQIRINPDAWKRWLNSRRIVDDVLPLPQGPGLLVRSAGRDGRVSWTLKVLRADGIATYAVPVPNRRPFDRLHGDVRNGRIALLRSPAGAWWRDAADLPAEIFLLELPGAHKGETR